MLARVIPLVFAVGSIASLLLVGHANISALSTLPIQQSIGNSHIPGSDLPPRGLTPTPTTTPTPAPPVAPATGKLLLIDLAHEWLWAFQDGHVVYSTPVTTGQPALATPVGTFNVHYTVTDTWFTSAWQPGSPYYFAPLFVHYGLYFRDYGFFIHDATWRHQFGPGTNVPHTDADGTHETGSHGCIEVPLTAMTWLYHWATVGTRISIVPSTQPAPVQPPPAPKHALPGKTGTQPV